MATPEHSAPENLKKRIKESYDAIAPTYNAWTKDRWPIRLEFVDKLISLLDIPSSTAGDGDAIAILELGAGAGLPATARLLASSPRPPAAKASSSGSRAYRSGRVGVPVGRFDWWTRHLEAGVPSCWQQEDGTAKRQAAIFGWRQIMNVAGPIQSAREVA
ncbi:hypothetical protein MAPG_07237 [Magnaporthiopsis poae ATCC 64411]|uniref:Uncharacterized protein n=1 Tax=Magnaporthiopsis poae (strain ATCC 64411 / 73-15) TaxID=644358 RepID=A0A0C4E449_MAGP6|nr:hypothetical protein MAPG_07237 [Magnaporthiopsis poae ATCC 64411]